MIDEGFWEAVSAKSIKKISDTGLARLSSLS
jgi:hypothetical protein